MFSVEPQSTMSDSVVQLVVKQNQNLDFEVKQQMVLNVRKTGREAVIIMLETSCARFQSEVFSVFVQWCR